MATITGNDTDGYSVTFKHGTTVHYTTFYAASIAIKYYLEDIAAVATDR